MEALGLATWLRPHTAQMEHRVPAGLINGIPDRTLCLGAVHFASYTIFLLLGVDHDDASEETRRTSNSCTINKGHRPWTETSDGCLEDTHTFQPLKSPKSHLVSFASQSCLSLEFLSSLGTGCHSVAHMEQLS